MPHFQLGKLSFCDCFIYLSLAGREVYEVIYVSSNGCDSGTEGLSAGGITCLIKVGKTVVICTIVSTSEKKGEKERDTGIVMGAGWL